MVRCADEALAMFSGLVEIGAAKLSVQVGDSGLEGSGEFAADGLILATIRGRDDVSFLFCCDTDVCKGCSSVLRLLEVACLS